MRDTTGTRGAGLPDCQHHPPEGPRHAHTVPPPSVRAADSTADGEGTARCPARERLHVVPVTSSSPSRLCM